VESSYGGGRGAGGDKQDCQPLPSCAAAHEPYETVKSQQGQQQQSQQTEHLAAASN